MTDTKVSLDDAVKHISSTLSQHADTIRRLEQTINMIQPHLETQIAQLRNDTQQELRTIETHLTSLIDSKTTPWTEAADIMQSLKDGLFKLKSRWNLTHTPPVPSHDPPTTHSNLCPLDTNSPPVPSPPLALSASTLSSHQPTLLSPYTIVVPSIASLPSFSGKSTERPRQFLLRVEEYTRTVNHWSLETLLHGISQYPKEDALEWYCQLYRTNNIPTTRKDFVTRFLAQFHSPIRAAQQVQAWADCKQQENETINQFVVRLRSLWLEQKPEEDEPKFTKHLFCKMRPDMLNLTNFSGSSSLETVLFKAQKVEEILFLRNKQQRLRDLLPRKSTTHTNYFGLSPSPATPNVPPLMDGTRHYASSTRPPNRAPPSQLRSPRTNITCWRCYETGHYSTECPINDDKRSSQQRSDYFQEPLPRRQKND